MVRGEHADYLAACERLSAAEIALILAADPRWMLPARDRCSAIRMHEARQLMATKSGRLAAIDTRTEFGRIVVTTDAVRLARDDRSFRPVDFEAAFEERGGARRGIAAAGLRPVELLSWQRGFGDRWIAHCRVGDVEFRYVRAAPSQGHFDADGVAAFHIREERRHAR